MASSKRGIPSLTSGLYERDGWNGGRSAMWMSWNSVSWLEECRLLPCWADESMGRWADGSMDGWQDGWRYGKKKFLRTTTKTTTAIKAKEVCACVVVCMQRKKPVVCVNG